MIKNHPKGVLKSHQVINKNQYSGKREVEEDMVALEVRIQSRIQRK